MVRDPDHDVERETGPDQQEIGREDEPHSASLDIRSAGILPPTPNHPPSQCRCQSWRSATRPADAAKAHNLPERPERARREEDGRQPLEDLGVLQILISSAKVDASAFAAMSAASWPVARCG
jgi:hypothetical protein